MSTLPPETIPNPSSKPSLEHSTETNTIAEDSPKLNGNGERTITRKSTRPDGRIAISEEECYHKLGFSFPTWRKWMILGVIFVVQVSMNLNTSIYGNAIDALSAEFDISRQAARVGQAIFLIAYAFGSELWAPWSEELGRWPVLQLSLLFVNIWQLPCAFAQNYGTIVVARFLGGLCSAGGSVTLGMVADMWEPDEQQYAVNFIVLSSVGGSVVGPVVGGFVQQNLHWRWVFWLQLIFGETRSSVLMTREAKRRRKAGETNIYGPDEIEPKRLTIRQIITIWVRPFEMFLKEPIVLCLSLLSGFSDSLIFTFLESYAPVYKQWNFTTVQIGLAFLPLLVGYVIAYLSFFPFIYKQREIMRKGGGTDALQPEARLYWLLWTAPLEPIGLFGFAWTSLGPPNVHWIAPMLFSVLIAVANFAIYMATIDYMVAAYGPYSASATGGNAFARDFLAGVAAMYSIPFYENIGDRYALEWPSTILGCIGILVVIPVYIFYWNGPAIRERSKFALTLDSERKARGHHVASEREKAQTGHFEVAERKV
ncbi:MFS general substrate transporter [Hymenopellis radicata]|nr:MFS general substrate transporter [Hymenopellis radicata]